jgi:chloramphenicol O-acetyltransferase
MPLEVQAHHALMDGVHMGQFSAKVQDHLHHPDFVTGSA